MRLALVTHKFIKGEGQGRVNYEIACEALRQGHSVILLATHIAPDLEKNDAVTWIRMPVTRFPTNLVQNHVFSVYSTRWLKHNRDKFDLLHLNGSISEVASDVNAAHFVHSAWMRSPVYTARVQRGVSGLYQWIFTAWNSRCERRAFRSARRVVAVSNQVRDELVSIGVPTTKVSVIVNGVDLEEFQPGVVSRTPLGLPSDVPLALFVGDLQTPRKNIETMLKALLSLPDVHLAVVGEVQDSPYPKVAEQLGVSERVHFLGYRRDIADLMRGSDVFVSLARYEPFSLVLLEAMACGLPVVTAKTVGAAQIVTAESGVVLPETDDVDALSATLGRLLADPQLRICMGQAARKVAENYSWTTMSNAYLDVYQELTS